MNSKAITVLAVVVMAVSGCAVIMSEQTEAAPVDLGTTYIDGSKTAEVELRFNEYAYTQYDSYEFTISAYIGTVGDLVYSSTDASIGVKDITAGEGTLNVGVSKVTDTTGIYKISVNNDADDAAPSDVYRISFYLNVTAFKDGAKVLLDPFSYTLTVNVRSFDPVNFEYTDRAMTAGVSGEFILSQAETDEKQIDVPDYVWYATNLVPGLNVGVLDNGSLAIYGMTATSEDNIEMKNIVIVGRDSTGNEVRDTIESLTIKATPKITYEISVDETAVKPVSGNVYMFESSDVDADQPVLKITAGDDTRKITVSLINTEYGTRKTIDYTGSVELPINEVGRYVVEMTVYFGSDSDVNNSTGLTTTAILEVVPNITGAGAGFIVVGGI